MKYYSYQNLPGVALGPLRIAILRSPYPVSDPLSTLTAGDESGNSGFPEDDPRWTTRTENGVERERRPWHFQPRTCTPEGDLAILDLHPGYPVPHEDIAEIVPIGYGQRSVGWFQRTTGRWVGGTFQDFDQMAGGVYGSSASTDKVVSVGDIGSIVRQGDRVVGFVSRIWADGTGFDIARLTELHRTVGTPIPQVPPEPAVEPPKPVSAMLPVMLTFRPTAWEYMVVQEDGYIEHQSLNNLGRDGWELCGIHHNNDRNVAHAYLKRPLVDRKGTT